MKRVERTLATGLLAVAMICLSPLARAQVLDQVPSDALVVIKFNKLKATNEKIGAMANKLGIAQFQPDFADPLGSFKREMKITNGLDENGEAAMVILNGPQQRGEPPILLLLPVSDYKAFTANFADAKADGEFTTFKFGGGQPSYAANWGKYAAIGNRKEAIAKKPTGGIKPAGVTAKELSSKDIVAYVNLAGSRDKILPEISKARAEFLRNFERGYQRGLGGQQQPTRRRPGAGAAAPQPATQPANANAEAAAVNKFMPVMKTMFGRLFDAAEQAVKDADAATWGVSLTDDGIHFSAVGDFQPASPSGQQIAKLKPGTTALTAGLPATKYMAVGAIGSNSNVVSELYTSFVAPMQKEAAAMGTEGQALQKYLDSIKKMIDASKSVSWGWVQPTGPLGQDAIIQVVSVSNGDVKKMQEAQKEMYSSQQAFMEMFQPPQMRGMTKISFQENAKTVDGVPLSLMKTEFGAPAAGQQQSPQMMQMKQMMTWMYGPNGMQAYSGAVGADKMVVGVGINDATMAKLIASAKANDTAVGSAAPVKAVDSKLPANRLGVAYIHIDNIATTIANYAKMFGMPVNFKLPADLPPIGVAVGNEGSALRADYYIPAQTVQSVVAGVIQTYMQMQGGQQPGGPGGL